MKSNPKAYLIAFFGIIIWGGSPVATQIAVTAIDAMIVGVLRTIIAALILLPTAIYLKLPRPYDKETWTALFISVFGGFIGFTLLFTMGVKYTSTAHAALILATAPIFTGFIGFFIDKKWPNWIWWIGAFIALAGEFFLISYRSRGSGVDTASLEGDLLVLTAIILASAGYVLGGKLSIKIGTWATTAWGISIAGIIQLPLLIALYDLAQITISPSNLSNWYAVIYLAVFTSIIGYVAWYWALGEAGVARISPIQFLQPIISLILAVILLNEHITPSIIISLGIILLGVAITKSPRVQA